MLGRKKRMNPHSILYMHLTRMGIVIFYKNAARVGSYIQCTVTSKLNESTSISVREAIAKNLNHDCILPYGLLANSTVIVCKLSVKVCDEFGSPKSDAPENISPDIYIRTDRGAWNVYHRNCRFLIPKEGAFPIQLCTKERRNVMRAALILDFVNETAESVAQSDILLVLSKPPSRHESRPFARVVKKGSADAEGIDGTHSSPTKWLSGINKDLVIIPEGPTENIAPWCIHSLGSYRSILTQKQKEDELLQTKRKRINEDVANDVPKINIEAEALQNKVLELQSRIRALENERDGLAKALRLLK